MPQENLNHSFQSSTYLIQQEELLAATGYQTLGRLKKHLDAKQIWYDQGKGGRIYTTPAAFESLLKSPLHTEVVFDGT